MWPMSSLRKAGAAGSTVIFDDEAILEAEAALGFANRSRKAEFEADLERLYALIEASGSLFGSKSAPESSSSGD